MANVTFVKPELSDMLPSYKLIEDCIAGDQVVKRAEQKYLPMPNVADQSVENKARYLEYIARAVFYNVTKRTLAGLLGQVTAKDAQIVVPTLLNPVVKDADGKGTSLEQLMNYCESLVVPYGRAGVFTDFPKVDRVVTRKQQEDGAVRPTITVYKPWDVINWRTRTVRNVVLLSLVVLRESYEDPDSTDMFEPRNKTQYRVLMLNERNEYVQEIWRQQTGMVSGWAVFERIDVVANGKPLTEIPFKFVGSEDNNADVDAAPLYDIAALNIAHYHNSADYEENVYITGQPTLFMSGIPESWTQHFKENKVYMGSRTGIALPTGASAELIQAAPNTLAFEAMEHKERQMVALGAKLVEQSTVQRTATEANQESASETSVLKKITKNVNEAFKWSMEWAAIFAGAMTVRSDATSDTIKTELNTDFDVSKGTPEQINAAINAWQKGALTFTEMRTALTRAGMATQTTVEAKTEIEADQLSEAEMFKQTADITGQTPENVNE